MRQRIDQLGQAGLNSDTAPTLLPANVCTRMLNAVTTDGAINNVSGELWLRDIDIEPIYQTVWFSPKGEQFFIISDGVEVHAYQADNAIAPEVITPVDGPLTGGFVSFANLNGVIVVNSETEGPFYWPGPKEDDQPVNPLIPLPGWDQDWRCKEMSAYRYHLVAMNMREGEDSYPLKLRWSDKAQDGSLPTEWVAAPSNEAGDDILGETTGIIMGGHAVRDKMFIIKEDAVYEMVWIGGQFIMQVSRLQGTIGTTSPRGWGELNGNLVLMSPTDLLLFDGQNQISLTDGRVRRSFFDNLSERHWKRSQIFYYPHAGRLFLCGVNAGSELLTDALVYDSATQSWGHKALRNCYGFDVAYSNFTGSGSSYDQQVSNEYNDWIGGSFNKGLQGSSIPGIVMYESNGSESPARYWISAIVDNNTYSDGAPKTCIAERIAIPLEGADGMAMVTDVWLDLTATGPVQVEIGTQETPDDPVRWSPALTIGPDAQAHVTPRETGRYISWRVSSYGDVSWRLPSMTIDWQRAGER